jgi:hypothetical protein
MKLSTCAKIRMVFVGMVAAMVLAVGSVKADFTFGKPTNLGPMVNSPRDGMNGDDGPTSFSSDGLEMYFFSRRTGGQGLYDIWVTKRETVDDEWGTPVNLGPKVNSSTWDADARISADGLELYFSSMRSGGYGDWDIWMTRRTTKDDAWGVPEHLGPVLNTSSSEGPSCLSPDGLELYFWSGLAGGYGDCDIWVTRRVTKDDPWGEPTNLGPIVNSSAADYFILSPDGLLFILSNDIIGPIRPDGFGGSDLWMSRRASISDTWGTLVNLGPIVNSPSHDCYPLISPDGSTLYFSSARPGGFGGPYYGDIWQSPIIPIVDLNGDGIVDSADMCIMVDNWGTDEPLCDIGPMPWGDGIVDVQDLIVLSKHLFEDYRLVAHWLLDEEVGNTAYDSTGKYDATLQGGSTWQPDGGKVGGSLQLDGVDDYVSTPFILNPAKGSFSISAWIKGGAPGQVVISQRDVGRVPGNTWLLADASYGRLMTRLMHPPFPPLVSESVITDDQWHHLGLVYDFIALHRYLYVDGIEVAKDSDFVAGVGSDGGFYIGADKTLDAAGFFSGLIDDVRIYNNVLSAEEIAALAQ